MSIKSPNHTIYSSNHTHSNVLFVVLIVLFWLTSTLGYAQAPGAFTIDVNSEPKKIGDIKPAFIVYKDKPLPQVSINYVLKRYIKLFETSESPSVKIDALNRINNLKAKYELESKKLSIDPQQESEAVLDSYNKIVDSGEFYQRMDELIYQTAKAMQFLGNTEESIKRLKMLVALYPRSLLVDESMFRMAEGYFDLGKYDEAAAQYQKILTFSQSNFFHHKSLYKLAWSQYRLDRLDESGKQAINFLNKYPSLKNALNIESVNENEQDLVDDSLRLLALMFAKQDGHDSIEKLQVTVGHKDYAYLLYDALFRFNLSKDRFQDAAQVAHVYTEKYPTDFNAYKMALNEIQSYKTGKFEIQEWKAKEHLVGSFGLKSRYWSGLNETQQQTVRPILVEYLLELSHLYYVKMQTAFEMKDKLTNAKAPQISYQALAKQAADYYLALVDARADHRMNGNSLYLAGEALYKTGDFQRAIEVYERAAYEQPGHADAINAGFAAILTYADLQKANRPADAVNAGMINQARRESIQRFATYFPGANQTPELLNSLANEYFDEHNYQLAAKVSNEVLSKSQAKSELTYSSGLVYAHSNFELNNYSVAEQAYEKLIAVAKDKDRKTLEERLAASIYKQAEQENVLYKSAELYLKVVDKVPDASMVPQALYDASSQFLQIKKWSQAIAALSVFQQRFPEHTLYQDASDKLVYAYLENHEPVSAAEKLVAIADKTKDKLKAANSLYKAAELYLENGFENLAMPLLSKFVGGYADSFDLAIEAQNTLISYYKKQGNNKLAQEWQENLVSYEKANDRSRTPRSASLAANAAFELSYEDVTRFESIKLSLPLKNSLEKKKTALKDVVSKLENLNIYNDAVIMSAATFQIGSIYRTLARDILKSERPDSLTELQLEQYNILLEEQAYPFEEQAMDIYKINLQKVAQGHYDKWIEATYDVMATMNPTEYKRDLKVTPYAETMY